VALCAGVRPKVDCESMKGRVISAKQIGLPTKGAEIRQAELGGNPEACTITGAIAPIDPQAPEIQFRVVVPTDWNQKSWHLGGGGTNGVIPALAGFRGIGVPPDAPTMLSQGFALYGSDSGHQNPPMGRGQPPDPAAVAAANRWINNEESWRNFAYEQLKKTHDAAYAVLKMMYGVTPKVSYFAGSSQGGREALMVVSRYPRDYDGVIAAVPLAYFAGLLIDPTVKGVTQLAPGAWAPPAKANLIRNEILRQCDSLDGIEDGVISNYVACNERMDPTRTPNPLAALRCPGGGDTGNDCLSDAQIATVDSFHAPVKFGYPLANGETDWPGWGTGLEGPFGWLLSNTQPDVGRPGAFNAGIGAALQRGRIGGSQEFNLLTLDLTRHKSQIQALSQLLDVREDWSGFLRRKGKLIIITANSDYIANPRAMMRLYERVVARHGQAAVDRSVRFYVMPNAGHGLSGSSAKGVPLPQFHELTSYLQDWVERGVAPPEPVVQVRRDPKQPGTVLSSRPLCRYPKYPRYKGAGDPNLAASYECAMP
jgi:feruloyl esterase